IRIDYNVTDANIYVDTQKRDTVTAPGPNGPITWAIDWGLLHIGGDGRKYVWTSSPPNDQTQLQDVDFQFWVVKYLQLPITSLVPLGQAPSSWNSYEFQYSDNSNKHEGYGELAYARTPSGAVYNYAYKWEHYGSQNPGYADTKSIAHDNSVKDKTVVH